VPPKFATWSDVYLRGPYLTLEVDPGVVLGGATLTFSSWRGEANGALLLVVSDLNGTPMFLPAVLSNFDAVGAWNHQVTVPSGLADYDITLEAFGIIETGKVNVSNPVVVSFQ
jgi:hypothetical protein